MHDVTRRNQLFRRRDKMLEALGKSNQALVNLTGVIANDLGVPLQRVDQLLSAIEPAIQDSDPTVTNSVNMAGQSIQQMQGLVAGMLPRCVERLRANIDACQAACMVEGDLSVVTMGTSQLERVIRNLIDNAPRYRVRSRSRSSSHCHP
jgi:signal transduction histidine kinase